MTEALVPLALTRARISNAMPGLDAVPVICKVELSKHETVGVGIPDSASIEYAYVRPGSGLELVVLMCWMHDWVG